MKTIKDAVIDFKGEWPALNEKLAYAPDSNGAYAPYWVYSGDFCIGSHVCTRSEFEAEAKRMGFVNGYQYGKEYPTNGEKPNLPDDVEVSCLGVLGNKYGKDVVSKRRWNLIGGFIITDERYKPSEQSNADTWFERGELPPVGAVVAYKAKDKFEHGGYTEDWNDGDELEVLAHKSVYGDSTCVVFNIRTEDAQCLILDCIAPIRQKTEREKAIDAALTVDGSITTLQAGSLYDAGLLRLLEEK